MVETFIGDIVTALAANARGVLAEAAATAVGKLAINLRERLRKDPAARGALEIVVNNAGDPEAQGNLVEFIGDRIQQDPEFAAWLRSQWELTRPMFTQLDGQVTNIVRGDVSGTVVQLRDVTGGVHLGPPEAGPLHHGPGVAD